MGEGREAPDRRHFLSQSALVAGGLAAVAAQSGRPGARRPVGAVVVGDDHEALLKAVVGHPLARILEVCQCPAALARRAARAAARRQAPAPRHGGDWRGAIASAACEAVIIALPPGAAGQVARAAAALGKAVLVAAPLDAGAGREYLPHRAYAGTRQAIDYLRKGGLGAVSRARLLLPGPAPLAGRLGRAGRQLAERLDLAFWGLPGPAPESARAECASRHGRAMLSSAEVFAGAVALKAEVLPPSAPPVGGLRDGVVFEAELGLLACCPGDGAVAFGLGGEILRVFKGSGDALGDFLRSARENQPAPTPSGLFAPAAWRLLAAALPRA